MSTFTNTAREVEMPNGDVVVIHNAPTGGENTTSNIKKFKYDDNGHVTESTAADAEDLNLSGYSTPTTGSTDIGTSDDVQTAIGKLDHQSHIDQTNILLVEQMNGTKNIVDLDANTVKTVNASGLTFTIQQGTITVNGTPNGVAYIGIPFNVKAGQWFISGCPSGGGSENYLVDIRTSTGGNLYVDLNDTGSGFMFTVPTDTTLFYDIRIASNYTANNLTFKPMIISKAAHDAGFTDFQSFALSNQAITPALIEQVDEGAKNRLSSNISDIKAVNTSSAIVWASNGCTLRGITFVINDDKTISISGTATDIVTFRIPAYNLKNGSVYVISGCPASGSVSTYSGRTVSTDGSVLYELYDYGTGASFTADRNAICYEIRIANGYAVGGTPLIFKPMLCTEADWNISHKYAPPALPNYDLTVREAEDRAALAEQVDEGAKNLWINGESGSISGYRATFEIGQTLKAGTYEIYFGSLTSTDTDDTTCMIVALNNSTDQYTTSNLAQCNRGNNVHVTLNITANTSALWIYSASSSQTGSGDSATFSNGMICTEADWKISQNYAPFALPNYDLTQLQAEDRAALAEQVDEGAKNIVNPALFKSGGYISDTTGNVNNSSNSAYMDYLEIDSKQTYYITPLSGGSGNWGAWYDSTKIFISGFNSYGIQTPPPNAKYLRLTVSYQGSDPNYESTFMICTKPKFDISSAYKPYALPNTDLTRMVNDLQKKAVKVYTYHVNPNESDPEDAVTYLDDATGLTPAKMGASSFSYGSWANAWFLPRPCVLKFDGTVDYYLNPNDYSKKTDGTASTIDSSNSTGNVMLEFPKIWVKRVNDGNGARTVSIAPVNVDGTYKCWSNINAEDKEVDHFYLPAYNGTIHSSKMRSLSGVTLDTTYAPNYTRAQEVTAAIANNPSGKNMWYTETWADMCLVYDLLYLMGKSLDVQRTFGQGLSSGAETAMRAYVTGSLNDKGLFYGDISGTSTAVKVLGMENLWGCRWHGIAGLINDNGTLKVKMTYGVADGSTTVGYNTTGSGYLNYGSTYGTAGFVKKMQADNVMGYKIIETTGTDATYYCDYYYVNNSQSNYALLGGSSGDGARCGFSVGLSDGAAFAYWSVGGSLSCRPES